MSKRWHMTAFVEPPEHTVTGRFGASVMSVWHSRFLNQWYWICGSSMEKIAEPQMLFLDPAKVKRRQKITHRTENPLRIKRSKTEQLLLNV
jgi:hypothetical protein